MNHLIKVWYEDRKFETHEFTHLTDAYATYLALAKLRQERGISVMTLVNGRSGSVIHSIPSEV